MGGVPDRAKVRLKLQSDAVADSDCADASADFYVPELRFKRIDRERIEHRLELVSTHPKNSVERLSRLFRKHPAWCKGAGLLENEATSNIYFSEFPGRAWHLVRVEEETRLLPGTVESPDFVFRFPPEAVNRLSETEGGVGAFAETFFMLLAESDPVLKVDYRIVAPFSKLVRRGYVRLLMAGGPGLLRFGVARGVRTLADLRRLVARSQSRVPAGWEETSSPREKTLSGAPHG